MKKIICVLASVFIVSFCLAEGIKYDHLEVYGMKNLLSYDDTQGGTYKWAYESRCTSEDERNPSDRFGLCLVMISNCTKGRLTADGSVGKKAIMISNDIASRSSATGAVYWSGVFRGGSGAEGKQQTFLYSHYLKMDDPNIQGTGRPVYFTMRCWNQRMIPFDPKGESGLHTAKHIIEIIGEAGAFAPYVGHFIHAFALMFKYGLNDPPPPPNPNDFVYRFNAYMVTANPKLADFSPQYEVLYSKDGKPAYDSYALHCAGQREEDASSNYVVQNSCIRSIRFPDGCYSIPIYVVNIYYSKDYYAAKLIAYCHYIKDLGWDRDNNSLTSLTDKMTKSDMNRLSERFGTMKEEDIMKINDAIDDVFNKHNDSFQVDNTQEETLRYQEAIKLLGNI